MIKISIESERIQLGFAESVISYFDFLTRDYGFVLIKADPTFVRFESPNVFANIYHGRMSFEIGFEIGYLVHLSNEPEQFFSIGDILSLTNAREEPGFTHLQANTAQGVKEATAKLAVLVKRYAGSALSNAPSIFAQLVDIQSRKSDELIRKWELADIREKVGKAWQEKNYGKIVELFDPVSKDLTLAELKKLEYAKKHWQ